mgnify:CR=1 FL=1
MIVADFDCRDEIGPDVSKPNELASSPTKGGGKGKVGDRLASTTSVLGGSTEDQETGDLLRRSGLLDRFFEQRPVGLCIESLHGLTF